MVLQCKNLTAAAQIMDMLNIHLGPPHICLLYTSDAADEEDSVDLGGRRIIKKKKKNSPKVN